MFEPNQIVIPPSFIALFVPPGRSRPSEPRDAIATRYELCEDLASLLTEKAKTLQWELGVTEGDVLERVHRGLLGGEAGLRDAEAFWVTCRLAELLEWPLPVAST